jgi:hypothetical protein
MAVKSVDIDNCIKFLTECHAKDIEFFERDLLDHLKGTFDVLMRWQSSDHLVLAGLFHAIYLTDFFTLNEPNEVNRKRVTEILGAEPEEIAYRYCVMDRRDFLKSKGSLQFRDTYTGSIVHITKTQDQELVDLIWANAIEQLEKINAGTEDKLAAKHLFEGSRERAGSAAQQAYLKLYS